MIYDENFFEQFDKFLEFFSEKKKNRDSVRNFHKIFVERRNRKNMEKFNEIPFSKRIILVPQCLRDLSLCQAREKGFLYECGGCGGCPIHAILEKGRELGYLGIFILKGGRAVKELIEKYEPEGVLGVSCWYEGFLGIIECENHDVVVTCYPLLKDGCVDTKVDVEGLMECMSRYSGKRQTTGTADS